MYTIDVYDGEHWQHVLSSDDRYTVESATLSESVNAAPVLTFKVYEGHPSLSYLLAAIESSLPATAQPTIMARRDGSTCFEGRIYQHVLDDLTGAHEFACEGMLARLNDYTVSPYSYSGTVQGYLDMLLTECEGALSVGNVTVTDPNNYIVRSSEQPVMLWDEIADKCIGSTLGGFLEMRSGYIVDWLTQPSASTATQDMEAGINLTGLNITVQPREMYSGVLAYGADVGVTNSKGVPLYYNLSFLSASDVPTGYTLTGMTLFKDSLVDQIGQRVCIVHYESITQISNLLARAESFLNSQSTTPTIQVGAVDLADAGYNADAIECGSTVQITGATFDASMMCTAISRDLLDPSNTTFEFGSSESISGSGGSGGSGGGSVTSPHFWHTNVENNQFSPSITEPYTGMSTLPLEDALTDIVGAYSEIDGGAVWLVNTPKHNNVPYDASALQVRANNLNARIVSASLPLYEAYLTLMGTSAMLGARYTNTTRARVSVDGYNGNVDITATNAVNVSADTNITGDVDVSGTLTSDELDFSTTGVEVHLSNKTKTHRIALTAVPNIRIDASSDGGSTWSTHGYVFHSGTSRTANTVLAAPNGSAGGASFRKLVTADMDGLGDTAYGAGQSGIAASSAVVSVAASTAVNMDTIVLAPGTWLVTYAVEFASNSAGYRRMTLTTNATSVSSTPVYMESSAPAVGYATNLSKTQVIVNSGTSNITRYLNVYHTGSAALNCRSCIQAVRIA